MEKNTELREEPLQGLDAALLPHLSLTLYYDICWGATSRALKLGCPSIEVDHEVPADSEKQNRGSRGMKPRGDRRVLS